MSKRRSQNKNNSNRRRRLKRSEKGARHSTNKNLDSSKQIVSNSSKDQDVEGLYTKKQNSRYLSKYGVDDTVKYMKIV